MLVLTRKVDEVVHLVEPKVDVKVVAILKDGRVRLGFDAPQDVTILRDDVRSTSPRRRTEVSNG